MNLYNYLYVIIVYNVPVFPLLGTFSDDSTVNYSDFEFIGQQETQKK